MSAAEREAVTVMREEIARVLRGAGLTDKPAEFHSSIHSWRCEYPDRYGACDCFDELVSDLEKAVRARWPVLAEIADVQADHDPRLDAVRALHQPLDAINVDAPPGKQRTRVCAVCAGSSGPWAVWPCATIQAIEGDDR